MTSVRPPDEELHAVTDEIRTACVLLLDAPAAMGSLRRTLEDRGHSVDLASDLGEARTAFFGAGGHDCVVIGPGVSPGLAQKVRAALSAIDPELAFATYGPPLPGAAQSRTARLASFHPGSRAGQGALLRFLQAL